MTIEQLHNLRYQSLEKYAQLNADADQMEQDFPKLRERAKMVLDEIRVITSQINQIQEQQKGTTPNELPPSN